MSTIIPLHKDRHRSLRVAASVGTVKARHMLPLVVQEFVSASAEFPIVFVKNSDTGEFQPVLLLGFRPGENLYLGVNGWSARFVPGCIRNQPFKLIQKPDSNEELMVAVDEGSALVGDEQGQRLFEDNGDESDYLQRRKRDLIEYFEGGQITRGFAAGLVQAELLAGQNLVVDIKDEKIKVDGLYFIDEKRLNALPEAAFNDLRARGFLPAIYAHLISLQQIPLLSRRISGVSQR